jgi:cytochrome c peroxidase
MRSELLVGFEVSDEEVNDLVAFLDSLTDTEFLTSPKFANPW